MSTFVIGTAKFTNGGTTVTEVVLTDGKLAFFSEGTQVAVGEGPVVAVVEAVKALAVDSFRLAKPWAHVTGTYPILATMTSEGIWSAVTAVRTATQRLSEADAVISALANVYEDTAAGLLATSSGEIFFVGGTGDTFLTQYFNNAGVAEERTSLPASTFIQQAVDAVAPTTQARDEAVAARNKAEEWATSPTEVEAGKESAKTYAEQTSMDAAATGQDAIDTAADRVATGQDRVQTGLDAAATEQDAIDTAADRVQTGLDVVATGEDRTQTGLDAIATAADRVQTGLDVVAAEQAAANALTSEQAASTSETNSATSANESLASKNLAEWWASEDEDVVVENGKFSSLHYAEKSAASATESEAQANASNAARVLAESFRDEAEDFSEIAAAYANFVGNYDNQVGALNIPASVYKDGGFWMLLVDLPDVTQSVPSNSNSDWAALTQELSVNWDSITNKPDSDGIPEGAVNKYSTPTRVMASISYGTAGGTVAQGNDSRITGAAQKSANLSDLAVASTARQNLGLGTAATRDVGESSGNVMEVGSGGWLTNDPNNAAYTTDYPSNDSQVPTSTYRGTASFRGISAYSPIFHVQKGTSWGRLIWERGTGRAFVESGISDGNGFTLELLTSGNILTTTGQSTLYPMTQKAVTDALSTKANASTQVIAGTGLSGGGSLAANRTLSVKYGTATGTAAQGNDSRINNGQTAFGWGNHASAGYIKSYVNTTYSAGTGITLSGTTFSLTALNAGSSAVGAVRYNGVSKTAGSFYGGTSNPTSSTRLNYDGYLYVTRSYSMSSLRYKDIEKVVTPKEALANVVKLGSMGVSVGTYKESDDTSDASKRHRWLIAEDVATVLKEAVEYDEFDRPDAVDYNSLIPELYSAIAHQDSVIVSLEDKVKEQGELISELINRLDRMEGRHE